jgi:hypothetical protein
VFLSLSRFPENVLKGHDFEMGVVYFEAVDFVEVYVLCKIAIPFLGD